MRRALPLLLLAAACGAPPAPEAVPRPTSRTPGVAAAPVVTLGGSAGLSPGQVPDRHEAAIAAYRSGLMPLHATHVDEFAQLQPEADGRGVLIAILDSGIDPTAEGLGTTSDGAPKLLDLRDFSGEGAIALRPARIDRDTVWVGDRHLAGAGRILAMAAGPVFGGLVPEVRYGEAPGADLDANGRLGDTLLVIVARGAPDWLVFTDRNRDGSLADDRPVRDYHVARESFGWSAAGSPTIGVAANIDDSAGVPRLDLVFDNGGHGTHVAGIAAGHDLFGVKGFDGVAPGARVLGLKIADNADGGVTTTGSMERAMAYAIAFAESRRMPLVINLSFGVGNQLEGTARIDAVVDSILAEHPDVVMTVSASNDGPGLSTLGFPASATRVLSVGATQPLVFNGYSPNDPTPDPVALFSSRGGERAGPEVIAPGTAWSSVPRFDTGNEEKSGTSMASPHVAGLAARLLSLPRNGAPPPRAMVNQALTATARAVSEATVLDQGAGVPDVIAAARWLQNQSDVPRLGVVVDGQPTHNAIWFSVGPAPTGAKLRVQRVGGAPIARLRVRTNVPWLSVEGPTLRNLSPDGVALYLQIDQKLVAAPGVYIGAVSLEDADNEALGVLTRIPVTIRVPLADGDGASGVAQVHSGGVSRFFFRGEEGRGFRVEVGTLAADGLALVALHEPGGQPFRDVPMTPAGHGDGAGLLEVDAEDAQAGWYEVDVLAPPSSGVAARVTIHRSPVRLSARLEPSALVVDAANLTARPLEFRLRAALTGAEWQRHLTGDSSAVHVERLPVPTWAASLVLDVTMPEASWSRFTDFGVSLRRLDGRMVAESPLNYAFGRMRVDLPEDVRGDTLLLVLSPAAAVSTPATPWEVIAAARFQAAQPIAIDHGGTPRTTNAPGVSRQVRFPFEALPVEVPTGWRPLVTLIALEGDAAVWTRELPLIEPSRGTP